MAIVGGAKVSTKLELLGNLMRRVDRLVIGGGMANTFLAATGKAIGKSLCEMEFADIARQIMADAAGAQLRSRAAGRCRRRAEIRAACADARSSISIMSAPMI